jgi:hypothetical protein
MRNNFGFFWLDSDRMNVFDIQIHMYEGRRSATNGGEVESRVGGRTELSLDPGSLQITICFWHPRIERCEPAFMANVQGFERGANRWLQALVNN